MHSSFIHCCMILGNIEYCIGNTVWYFGLRTEELHKNFLYRHIAIWLCCFCLGKNLGGLCLKILLPLPIIVCGHNHFALDSSKKFILQAHAGPKIVLVPLWSKFIIMFVHTWKISASIAIKQIQHLHWLPKTILGCFLLRVFRLFLFWECDTFHRIRLSRQVEN